MPTLYSYCIPYDNGAAPNPFWGVCTLVICKPAIRRVAKVGDWIVGTGSTRYGFQNRVVYAMEVTRKLTMEAYDTYCQAELPQKLPDWNAKDFQRKLGDCIYDFSTNPPIIRGYVHNEGNRTTDLGGEFALLSNHFYYFGGEPICLPDHLLSIVNQGQSHKSIMNHPYYHAFVEWIIKQTYARNNVYANPHTGHLWNDIISHKAGCALEDKLNAESDELIKAEYVAGC